MLFIAPLLRLLWVVRPLVVFVCSLLLVRLFFALISICLSIRWGLFAVCVRSSLAVTRLVFVASRCVPLWCACLACVLLPPLLFPSMASPFRGGRRRRYNRTIHSIYFYILQL